LRDAARGVTVGSGQLSGPADSLPALVDRLVVAVLGGRSGVSTQQLAGLTSVPALRAYLAGLAAYRQARYVEALQHFDAALSEDSTFALAAMAAIPSAWRGADDPVNQTVAERAFRMRGRLHGGDSVMLRAYLGDRMPDDRTMIQNLADWEQATQAVPDRAEAWFELGDRQLHQGLANDYPDALARARQSLQRALALDSSLAIAVDHLLMLALHEDDSAAAARLAPLYQRTGSRGDWSGAYDWLLAVAQHDTVGVLRARTRFPEMSAPSLAWIVQLAMLEGGTIEDAQLASDELVRRASTASETRGAEFRAQIVALNGGHRARATTAAARRTAAGAPPALVDFLTALAGDLGDGDTAAASAARARLMAMPHDTADERRDAPGFAACAAGVHGIAVEDSAAVRAAQRRLRALLPREPQQTMLDGNRRLCASVLDAALAVASERLEALARADSIYLYSLATVFWYLPPVLARLYDVAGQPREALRVLRRRFVASNAPAEAVMLPGILKEEGRLAESVDDTSGAIIAYRRYLALRMDPDSPLVPQRDSVRFALAALRLEPRPGPTARR
jgi:tetratricopeptide (TPR) repeat protein